MLSRIEADGLHAKFCSATRFITHDSRFPALLSTQTTKVCFPSWCPELRTSSESPEDRPSCLQAASEQSAQNGRSSPAACCSAASPNQLLVLATAGHGGSSCLGSKLSKADVSCIWFDVALHSAMPNQRR